MEKTIPRKITLPSAVQRSSERFLPPKEMINPRKGESPSPKVIRWKAIFRVASEKIWINGPVSFAGFHSFNESQSPIGVGEMFRNSLTSATIGILFFFSWLLFCRLYWLTIDHGAWATWSTTPAGTPEDHNGANHWLNPLVAPLCLRIRARDQISTFASSCCLWKCSGNWAGDCFPKSLLSPRWTIAIRQILFCLAAVFFRWSV